MTNKELLEDLLIEFDELGMEPTTIVPNPSERAIRWKQELMCAIEHLEAEVAREIFEEIEKILDDSTVVRSFDYGRPYFAISKFKTKFAALKKKYTEETP
jgi:hypothetical protein